MARGRRPPRGADGPGEAGRPARAGSAYHGTAVTRDPVRFIVSVTSSAASSAPQDSRPAESHAGNAAVTGTGRVKRGMADMLKGGVIMDVVTPEQAKIAEDAG